MLLLREEGALQVRLPQGGYFDLENAKAQSKPVTAPKSVNAVAPQAAAPAGQMSTLLIRDVVYVWTMTEPLMTGLIVLDSRAAMCACPPEHGSQVGLDKNRFLELQAAGGQRVQR